MDDKDATIERLRAELAASADTLTGAGRQFTFYERQHLAKTPPDTAKAATNTEYAVVCAAAAKRAREAANG